MSTGRIEKIEVLPLNLPFLTEFKISRGSVGGPKAGAPHVYLRITTDTGITGWGEARPSHRWSYETVESVVSTIRNYLAPALIGTVADDFSAVREIIDREIAPGITVGQPVAKSGVDMALHDLASKANGLSLSQHLGEDEVKDVLLSYLVSVDSPAKAEKVTQAALDAGYTGF